MTEWEKMLANFEERNLAIQKLEVHLQELKSLHRKATVSDFGLADGEVINVSALLKFVTKAVRSNS